MTSPSQSKPTRGPARRYVVLGLGLLALLWLASGVRRVDTEREFGVIDSWLLGRPARQIDSGWALAPAGLARLTRYPRQGVELALPTAEEAMLPSVDGSRFGFRGWATLRARPDDWRRLHQASGGAGLRGALVHALRSCGDELDPQSDSGRVTASLAYRLEDRIRQALDGVGVELRALRVESVDYLAADPDTATPTETRLLVVGLDGADWAIIDPLIAEGRLPNLARLIEGGVRAKLHSISPMLSPVIWTTVATGVEPSRHGVLDFLVEDPGGAGRQPVTSAQRRVPTVWEILSRNGVDVGIVGWWASWPADAVRGYLVSDRLAYQLFGYRSDPADATGKSWPPDLYPELQPMITPPDSVTWERVLPYLDGPRREREAFDEADRERLDELRTLLAAGDTYRTIARSLSQRFEPQLEVVYFEGTDTVGHLFMPFRPPRQPGIDPQQVEAFGQVVDRYYETADAYLGQLLDGRDESWTVMIVSDHGFASDSTRPRSTDSRIGHGAAADWHRRFGILILSGSHVQPGATIDEASVYDVAPTILALFGQPVPRSWPGKVLWQALDPAFLDEHPVRYRNEDPEREELLMADGETPIDPAAAELVQKLQTLGYVSSGTGDAEDSLTARNNAGVALMAEGRYAEAEREFRAGLEIEPLAAMLRFNLGMTLYFQGRADEATARFTEALGAPSTMRMAGLMLAQIRLRGGNPEAAGELLERVLATEPDAADLRNLLGVTLERRGDVEGARKEYLHAARLDPDVAMPRNNLGNLAKLDGDLETAEQWYLRAIEADPYFMPAYNNLALVYQDRGQLDRALDLYGRALGKAPNNAELLNNVGSWYYQSGDHDEAQKLWQRAALVDPAYPSPLNNLASLRINAQAYAEAERLLRRALELDPGYGDARINLSLVLRRRGQAEAALAELRRAAEDPLAAPTAWLQLGFLELERGFVDAAIQALDQAGRLLPGSVQVLNGLGEAYRRKGQRDRALEMWRRSLTLDPDQARVRQSLEALEQAAQPG